VKLVPRDSLRAKEKDRKQSGGKTTQDTVSIRKRSLQLNSCSAKLGYGKEGGKKMGKEGGASAADLSGPA